VIFLENAIYSAVNKTEKDLSSLTFIFKFVENKINEVLTYWTKNYWNNNKVEAILYPALVFGTLIFGGYSLYDYIKEKDNNELNQDQFIKNLVIILDSSYKAEAPYEPHNNYFSFSIQKAPHLKQISEPEYTKTKKEESIKLTFYSFPLQKTKANDILFNFGKITNNILNNIQDKDKKIEFFKKIQNYIKEWEKNYDFYKINFKQLEKNVKELLTCEDQCSNNRHIDVILYNCKTNEESYVRNIETINKLNNEENSLFNTLIIKVIGLYKDFIEKDNYKNIIRKLNDFSKETNPNNLKEINRFIEYFNEQSMKFFSKDQRNIIEKSGIKIKQK
jgi:hypothetical protein